MKNNIATMMKKLNFKPSDFLILLILFHLFGNIFWIKLNNIPPSWDQAALTKSSLQFLHFFQNIFHGKFNTEEFVEPLSDYYGPLVKLITATILFIFTPSIKLAQFTGTIVFLLTIMILYLLGKEIFKKDWIGLIAAFIFSFYQAVYDNSRWLLLDIPLTFFVLLTIYFLIKSEFFTNKKYALLSFISLALAVLTKFQAIIYLVIPFGYFLILSLKNKKIEAFKNIVLGSIITFLLVSPWIIISFEKLRFYYTFASGAKPFVDPYNLTDLTTWFHHLKLFIDYDISFFIFVPFIISLYFYLKWNSTHKNFFIFVVVSYYIIFTIFPSKDFRFLFPILPFTAIMFAVGFFKFSQQKPKLAFFILSSMITFNVIMYFSLSFGFPLQKGLRKKVNLPYIKDIVYFNLSDYPVRKFDSRYWPNKEIINDLLKESGEKGLNIVFIPNDDNFNGNTFSMYLESYKIKNIKIIHAGGRKKFVDEEELNKYLKNYYYFLYTPNEVGVFYQTDKPAFEQMQQEVKQLLKKEEAMILKTYFLPTGQEIQLVKRREFTF